MSDRRASGLGEMPERIVEALREIGPRIAPPETQSLYAALHPREPSAHISVTRDARYGAHERHVLDVFTSARTGSGQAVLIFVHGGGFTRGAKRVADSPFYDNIMLWAAGHDLVGVNVNYRLAPEHRWPAGIEDLSAVVAWVERHIGDYGGDPGRVFLWGHSAGAAHVGDYLAYAQRRGTTSRLLKKPLAARCGVESRLEMLTYSRVRCAFEPAFALHRIHQRLFQQPASAHVAGAILTSGFYDLGGEISVWQAYYGDDVSQYAARSSLAALAESAVPLLVSDAELDPESFRIQARELLRAREEAQKPTQYVHLPNHSHLSEIYAVGTADRSLSEPVLDFIRAHS